MSRNNIGLARRLIRQADKHLARSPDIAIDCLKKAAGFLKADDSTSAKLRLRALADLGKAYMSRSAGSRSENIERAIACYNTALHAWYRRKDRNGSDEDSPHDRVRALLAIAYDLRILGSREENIAQIQVHTDSLDLDKKKDADLLAAAKIIRGKAFRDRAQGLGVMDLVVALGFIRDALKIISRRRNPHLWAEAHLEAGKTLLALPNAWKEENWRDADQSFQRALTVFRPPEEPVWYALVQVQLGNYSVRRSREDRGANYRAGALGHYSMALNQLSPIENPREWSEVQVALARLAGPQARDIASFHLESALEGLTNAEDRAIRIGVLRDLASLHLHGKAWKDAIPKFAEAMDLVQAELRDVHTLGGRRAAVEDVSGLANSLAYCHYRLGELDAAVNTLESGKSLLLAERLRCRDREGAVPGNRKIPSGRSSVKKAAQRQQLARLYRRIRNIEATQYGGMGWIEDSDRLSVLRRRLNALQDRIQQPAVTHPVSISEMAPSEPGSALVMLLISPAGGAVFVLCHQGTSVVPENVIPLPDLTSQEVYAWLVGSGARRGWLDIQRSHNEGEIDGERWLAAISALCKKLWGAVAAKLSKRLQELGVSAITVIPVAGLQFLPIHAAARGGAGPLHYLIDSFTIRYAPSAFVLRVSARRASSTRLEGAPLVAGISLYTSLPPLPNVRSELEMVASVLRVRILFDKDVSRRRILREMPSASAVHIACHGAAWALGGMLFRLSWAPPTVLQFSRDGLSFQDILELDLKGVRLVCLSACDTGAVDASLSWDEFEGLANVFLQAGAAAVVSSLWSVDDRSTSLLMQRLYANLHERRLAPADALREAQIWLRDGTRRSFGALYEQKIKQGHNMFMEAYTDLVLDGDPQDRPYAHPYYWAPFFLTGV